MNITCQNCFHKWESKKNEKDKNFCHKCGYNQKNKTTNLVKLKKWIKDNQHIVSEHYKKKLQKLAGLIK